jgi:hypothetical protein
MNLSDHIGLHFTYGELIASNTARVRGLDNTPDDLALGNLTDVLVPALERIRAEVFAGRPMFLHSVFRSVAVNHAVGGSEPPKGWSYHIFGLAADFDPPDGMTHDALQHAIAALPDLDFDLVLEESAKTGAHWVHFQMPHPGTPGRRLVRDAYLDTLGGAIKRTVAG